MAHTRTRAALAAALASVLFRAAPAWALDAPGWLPAAVHPKQWEVLGTAVFVVLTAFLMRRYAPEKRRRIRPAVINFLLYFSGIALATVFTWLGWGDRAGQVAWVAELLGTFTLINLSGLVFFNLMLKAVRVEPANIVSDLVVGFAYIVAFMNGLHRAGLDLSHIAATSAVVSGVIGISMAPTLGNILGGVALQLDNSISEGDWVQLDANTQGRVRAIRWRHTVVETRNWDTIIVPNATLLSGNIMILGKRTDAPAQRRYWIYFNVDFRFAPSEVIAVVNEALQHEPIANVAQDPKPHCICMDFARDGRDSMGYYAARYWLTNLAVDDPTNSSVRERIYTALKRAGMTLAMPASTVFLSHDDVEHQERKAAREHQRRTDLLATLSLFHHMTREEVEQIAHQLKYATFAPGETITRQGREAHWLYILARGETEVMVSANGGPNEKVGTLNGPTYFGEMACMTGEPRSATVVARSYCECYRLDKEAFQSVLERRKELAEMLSTVIVKRRDELLLKKGMSEEQARQKSNAERARVLEQIQSFFGLGGN